MQTINYSIDVISAKGEVVPIFFFFLPGNPIAIRHSLFKTIDKAFEELVTPEVRAMLAEEGSSFGVSFWLNKEKGFAIFGYTGLVSGFTILNNKRKELEMYRVNGWEVETESIYSVKDRKKIEAIKNIQESIDF